MRRTPTPKQKLAADVWRLMRDFALGAAQRGHHFALLKEFGLTPGHLKMLAALQKGGLINFRRGKIKILDREGLQECACECYSAIRERIDKALPKSSQPAAAGDGGGMIPYSRGHSSRQSWP